MTVIVWDGKTLAADRQATAEGTSFAVRKVHKIRGHLIGTSGDFDSAQSVLNWFRNGAEPKDWPTCQADKDRWCGLLVITPDRKILKYEREPFPYEIREKRFAMGSGRDFAFAAMHCGKTAAQAVKVAIKFDAGCGIGVDTVRL